MVDGGIPGQGKPGGNPFGGADALRPVGPPNLQRPSRNFDLPDTRRALDVFTGPTPTASPTPHRGRPHHAFAPTSSPSSPFETKTTQDRAATPPPEIDSNATIAVARRDITSTADVDSPHQAADGQARQASDGPTDEQTDRRSPHQRAISEGLKASWARRRERSEAAAARLVTPSAGTDGLSTEHPRTQDASSEPPMTVTMPDGRTSPVEELSPQEGKALIQKVTKAIGLKAAVEQLAEDHGHAKVVETAYEDRYEKNQARNGPFGEQVRELREQIAGQTQENFARGLECSLSKLIRVEMSTVLPSVKDYRDVLEVATRTNIEREHPLVRSFAAAREILLEVRHLQRRTDEYKEAKQPVPQSLDDAMADAQARAAEAIRAQHVQYAQFRQGL